MLHRFIVVAALVAVAAALGGVTQRICNSSSCAGPSCAVRQFTQLCVPSGPRQQLSFNYACFQAPGSPLTATLYQWSGPNCSGLITSTSNRVSGKCYAEKSGQFVSETCN
jgi:hypothetical protein